MIAWRVTNKLHDSGLPIVRRLCRHMRGRSQAVRASA
jgi:hypothetical protein